MLEVDGPIIKSRSTETGQEVFVCSLEMANFLC